ncbi:MAG: SsrA-binding protein SmpB [Verrucomicrobiota bacterium]
MSGDVINNRKARHNYSILETIEAGIVLRGTEVKSLRNGRGNLNDAFVRIQDGQAYLHNLDIQPYAQGNRHNHDPKASRRLLLHKSEIRKLFGSASIKGRTLVPLKMYWKRNRLKVLVGVGVGKTQTDKRETLKAKAAKREVDQAIKAATRR